MKRPRSLRARTAAGEDRGRAGSLRWPRTHTLDQGTDMAHKWIAAVAAVAMAAIVCWLAGATGLGLTVVSIVPALVVGAAFAGVIRKSGAKALLIPAVGFALGLAGTFALQLLAGGGSFDGIYYLFAAVMTMSVLTFFVSLVLLAAPKLRRRLLGA
ncbi:hypothetical protein [Lysobacter gummosus]|uniref:hypothetical protein n=2 Tax=Lysobacter gummosus TaxID=262324 RepID=UPI00362DF24C